MAGPSVFEQALRALEALLKDAFPGVSVTRDQTMAVEATEAGMIDLRQGERGEPEVMIGSTHCSWEAAASIAIIATDITDGVQAGRADELAGDITDVIEADPTLGGLVDRVEVGNLGFAVVGDPGLQAVIGRELALTIHYQTPTRRG